MNKTSKSNHPNRNLLTENEGAPVPGKVLGQLVAVDAETGQNVVIEVTQENVDEALTEFASVLRRRGIDDNPSEHIEVMVFEPGKPGERRTIRHTLDEMQGTVGGPIEFVSVAPGIIVVCDEEGRLKNLPINRWGLVGTFFAARRTG